MKNLLRLEQVALLGLSIYLFSLLDYAWWVYPLFLLAPDLSMLGYLAGPETGAMVYNLAHHKAIGLGIYIIGALFADQLLMLVGVILFGHSSMDRIFGYGLKYPDSFQNTHLGRIGKEPAGEA